MEIERLEFDEPDGGRPGAGGPDAGWRDAGRMDAGPADAGPADAGRGPAGAEVAESRGPGGADAPDIPNASSRLPADRTAERAEMPDRAAYHAEYRATVDAVYRADAISRGCDRVREAEETTVTPAMLRIEAQDPDRHLVGLEFRLKGRARLEEKVTTAMTERGRTPEEAFAEVKDAIRYTFGYPEDKYSDGVRADVDRLKQAGFELSEFRNAWAEPEYKGINSRWRIPETGQLFEVQFHTEASFAAKQETHGAYERLRTLPPDHEDVYDLRAYQREVSAKISIPPAASKLAVPLGGSDANEDDVLRDGR